MESITHISAIPALTADVIHIWGAEVAAMRQRLPQLRGLLSAEELEKSARFRRIEDQERSVVARGALRVLLGAYTSKLPGDLCFSYNANGKPMLNASSGEPLGFNVSHSGEWVVLAFGWNRQIGVDIEQIKAGKDLLAIAQRFFAPAEIALIEAAESTESIFFHLWSRKEAYVKTLGEGLSHGLNSFAVPIKAGALPEEGQAEGHFFYALNAGSKYASAVVSDRSANAVQCFDFSALEMGEEI